MATFLITAGELSGDILGAEIMQALAEKNQNLTFIGVGGPKMRAAGLQEIFPMGDIAVMGLVEIIPHIFKIKQRIKHIIDTAAVTDDLCGVLTIDAQEFSKRVAKGVKAVKPFVPRFHYAAPKVWAWRPNRARTYAQIYDTLFCLFPFETEFFAQYGLETHYVGHPVLQRLEKYIPTKLTPPDTQKIALLPGSRKSELRHHLEVSLDVFHKLKAQNPQLTAVIPLPTQHHKQWVEELGHDLTGVDIVMEDDRFEALATCRAALVKSGTANLELATMGVPMVVMYKANPLSMWLAKKLVKIPYISPVNWVLGRKALPEYIQEEANAENLTLALSTLLTNDDAWNVMADNYKEFRKLLYVKQLPAVTIATHIQQKITRT